MSVSTFKRNFEEFQTSPFDGFKKRLEHTYLLQTKKMRASDVYEEIGFENLSSFVQAYKKIWNNSKQSQINIEL
jgi:AraC-like DNA-binding protein